jgi:hypothetical protein
MAGIGHQIGGRRSGATQLVHDHPVARASHEGENARAAAQGSHLVQSRG